MRFATLLSVLLCCSLSARANDGAIDGVGGTFQPLKGEHGSVRMVREHVRMTILPDHKYRVTVDFIFHNDGPATRVLMGFPERGGGVDMEPSNYKHRSGFTRFATWVDGRRVRARYAFHSGKYSSYRAHWVKRVRFARGQTRRIRVRYLADCGYDSNGGNSADYDFTGGNWRGQVEESLVTVTFQVPGKHSVQGRISERNNTDRGGAIEHRRGNRLFYRYRHWEAEGEFSLYFKPVLRNPLAVNFEKPRPDQYEDTIDVPDDRPIYRANQPTNAALHAGMAAMALRDLGEWFDTVEPEQKDRLMPSRKWRRAVGLRFGGYRGPEQFYDVNWRERDRTAWLRVGVHVFGFRAGKARLVINGKIHRLPAPPLIVRDRGWHLLYVPLSPIMKALGGKAKMVRQQRRVWFHL